MSGSELARTFAEVILARRGGSGRLVQVDLTNPIHGGDKICCGVMDVFVEPIAPSDVR